MPLWMEILINVIGYAGFIGIAMFNKTSEETRTDQAQHSAPGLLQPNSDS